MPAATVRRLNWACGPKPAPGWINSDRIAAPGIELSCDVRTGLPVPDGYFDYAVSIHGLQDLAYLDVVPALRELRRVLRPGGVLRLALPDLDRAIEAYLCGDARYFYIPDDEVRSPGAKLVVQAIWYGSTRTPFTWDLIRELCAKVGYAHVVRCAFRETRSPYPGIVELDNRERESLFVEAVR
jgi:SAM-dependent methyltransferase